MLGLLVTYVDETYEGLVRMGFDIPAHIRVGAPPLTDSATPGLSDA